MAKLFLCRHGQDEDNAEGLLNGHRDRPLTALGIQQAALVAEKILNASWKPDVILASPLRRARFTAETIARRLCMPIVIHDELIERDFGVLTGRPLCDIAKYGGAHLLETPKVTYFLEVDGAETFPILMDRAKRVSEHCDVAFAGKTVLLVAHGDIGKMIAAVRQCVSWKDGLLTPYIANTEIVEM